jgi:iron complex transport system substrate-binding protein
VGAERARSLGLAAVLATVALSLGRVPASSVIASLEARGPALAASLSGDGAGALVLDDPLLGEHVVLRAPPTRIVSLTLASDVLLSTLVPASRVVAVTATVDDPNYSHAVGAYPAEIPRIAASAERILSLRPDLVVVSAYSHAATVRALIGAGIPVLRLPAGATLDELASAASLLSRAVGEDAAGNALVQDLARARAELAARPPLEPAPRVLFLAAGGFTHGAGTLTDDLIALAGARNVASERGLAGLVRIGAEVVAASRPDAIVVPADDEPSARASVLLAAPGLGAQLERARVIAIPSRSIEVTTPHAVEAARVLRAQLERDPGRSLREGP